MRVLFLALTFLTLMFPGALLAEEILPAICKQVLTPDTSTSIPKVLLSSVVSKAKEVPKLMAEDLKEEGDKLTASLANTLEAKKSVGSIVSADEEGSVLGTSTHAVEDMSVWGSLTNLGIDGLLLLLRHWLVSLAVLGGGLIYFLFRI